MKVRKGYLFFVAKITAQSYMSLSYVRYAHSSHNTTLGDRKKLGFEQLLQIVSITWIQRNYVKNYSVWMVVPITKVDRFEACQAPSRIPASNYIKRPDMIKEFLSFKVVSKYRQCWRIRTQVLLKLCEKFFCVNGSDSCPHS